MVSFHEVYERHAPDVYRFALFLSGNPAQAEDLASDTFARAWNARGRIREATVRAYLLTITRNLWRDARRRDRRLVPLDAAGEEAVEARGEQVADLGWTEKRLQQVADGDRVALLLHARDGLTYDEIAQKLAISVGAVKSRIFRARRALDALRHPSSGEEP